MKQSKYFFLLSLIAGLLYASAFPIIFSPSFPPGALIGIFIFLKNLSTFSTCKHPPDHHPLRHDLMHLLAFSLGHCIFGFYWLAHTMEVFGSLSPIVSHLLGLLFSLIILPQYLVFILAMHLITKVIDRRESSFFPLLIAFFLTILEYYTPQQFPAHLGHPWLHLHPYLPFAPIGGAPFYSFISFWLVISLITYINERKIDPLLAIIFPIFLITSLLFPLTMLNIKNIPIKENNIRFVQANIGNFLKIQSENGENDLAGRTVDSIYSELSLTNLAGEKPDLIIWPETAFPKIQSTRLQKESPYYIPKIFDHIIYTTGAEMFVGGYDRTDESNSSSFETQYNTAFFFGLDHNGTTILKDYYHKRKLIPFGETLPFGPFNKYLSDIVTNISYFAAGERYPSFSLKNEAHFISAICYEILFSSYIRDYLNSLKQGQHPHFIINLTNDSWYGKTSEPYQHLFLSKWRAMEFQMPLLRMTNTGVTSITYPDGSESERIEIYKRDILDIKLKSATNGPTPFQKYGLLNLLALFGVLILLRFFLGLFNKSLF